MATNVYFNPFPSSQITSEQLLVEDLVIEAMQIYGMDIFYLPRSSRDQVDYLYGEDTLKQYVTAYPIEMYLENVTGMDGEQDFISKFGLEIRDDTTLVLSKRRFEDHVASKATLTATGRPNEGDIVYVPLLKSFFEIQFVEDQEPFFQLGNLPVYKLRARTWEYSSERLDTGVTDIDSAAGKKMTIELNKQPSKGRLNATLIENSIRFGDASSYDFIMSSFKSLWITCFEFIKLKIIIIFITIY